MGTRGLFHGCSSEFPKFTTPMLSCPTSGFLRWTSSRFAPCRRARDVLARGGSPRTTSHMEPSTTKTNSTVLREEIPTSTSETQKTGQEVQSSHVSELNAVW